jgi:glycosyltransferase involved in cell wall biosynthesis
LGINKSKIHVFPHLVDIDYLKNFNKKNIESNIITITSFLPVKRTEDAIKALALTKDKGLNLKMVILGDGPDKGSLMELAIKLGLENSIVFEGFVEDIRPYINNSEYYLQTSSSEGLSIALIESMASGLIPIVTNVGDEKEVVKDYETGFFVPVGAPKEIANKLLLLDSNPLKKKIKNNIKQKMKRSSISYSNQYISSLLKSLM